MMNHLLHRIVLFFFIMSIMCACKDTNEKKQGASLEKSDVSVLSSAESVTPMGYMSWMENAGNGIHVQKKIGDYTFMAFYKPLEYVALLDLKKDSITEKKMKEKINEYKGLQYFTFRITSDNQQKELLKTNLNSEEDYYARIEYFSFKLQNDLKLIDGKDTLDCSLFHFERVYGLVSYATFVIGFPLTKKEEKDLATTDKIVNGNKTLFYEDRIFGAGNIYMTIKEENLNRIPALTIK